MSLIVLWRTNLKQGQKIFRKILNFDKFSICINVAGMDLWTVQLDVHVRLFVTYTLLFFIRGCPSTLFIFSFFNLSSCSFIFLIPSVQCAETCTWTHTHMQCSFSDSVSLMLYNKFPLVKHFSFFFFFSEDTQIHAHA